MSNKIFYLAFSIALIILANATYSCIFQPKTRSIVRAVNTAETFGVSSTNALRVSSTNALQTHANSQHDRSDNESGLTQSFKRGFPKKSAQQLQQHQHLPQMPKTHYSYQSMEENGVRTIRMDDYPFPSFPIDWNRERRFVGTITGILTKHGVPYVLGVSPLLLEKEDPFLQKLSGTICMHGFTHSTSKGTNRIEVNKWQYGGEFSDYNKTELREMWKKGNKILSKFPSYDPRQFISPFNAINQDMVDVLVENGVKYIHTYTGAMRSAVAGEEEPTGAPYGGWVEDMKVPSDVKFIVSRWQKTYTDVSKLAYFDKLDNSQITVHWYYDINNPNYATDYVKLATKIMTDLTDENKDKQLHMIMETTFNNYNNDANAEDTRFYSGKPLHKLLQNITRIEETYATKEFFEVSSKKDPDCVHKDNGIFCNVATGGLYLCPPIYRFVRDLALRLPHKSTACVVGTGSSKLEALLLSLPNNLEVETYDLFKSQYKHFIFDSIVALYGKNRWKVHSGRFENASPKKKCDLVLFDTNLVGSVNDQHWKVVDKYLQHPGTIMLVQHATWEGYESYCKPQKCTFKHRGHLGTKNGCYPDRSIIPKNMNPAVLSAGNGWNEGYQYGIWE